jgi:hypothetical protein
MNLEFQSSKVLIEEVAPGDNFMLLAAFLKKSSGEIELEIAFRTKISEEEDKKDDSFKPQKLPRM